MYGLKRKKVLVQIIGIDEDVISLTPPMTFGEEEVDRLVHALKEVLTELREDADAVSVVATAAAAAVATETPGGALEPVAEGGGGLLMAPEEEEEPSLRPPHHHTWGKRLASIGQVENYESMD